jgi:hypothetical protein
VTFLGGVVGEVDVGVLGVLPDLRVDVETAEDLVDEVLDDVAALLCGEPDAPCRTAGRRRC